jgi:hypothetical protein
MKALLISTDNNWVSTYRAINYLLSYGVRVLWSKDAIDEATFQETPGAFLIPLDKVVFNSKNDNTLQSYKQLTQEKIVRFLKSEKIMFEEVEVNKHINVSALSPTRVALYQDSGCYSHAFVLSRTGFALDWVTGMEVSSGILDSYDLFMSGGGGSAVKANINRENLLLASMGVDGAKKVNEFVKNGGSYFGFCGGSYIGSVVRERFMNWWHPAKKYLTMMNVEDYYIDENSDSGFRSPGQGVFIAKNVEPENPLMFGLPDLFRCVHWNGPVWKLIEAHVDDASSPKSVVELNDVEPEMFTPSEYFKTNLSHLNSDFNNTGFYKACKKSISTIAQGFYGTGLVVLSGSHPERVPGYNIELDKNTLWNSARILCNASFWAPSISNRKRKKPVKRYGSFVVPFQSTDKDCTEKLNWIRENTINLEQSKFDKKPGWLDQSYYTLAFGLTPNQMYCTSLEIIPKLCDKITKGLTDIDTQIGKIKEILNEVEKKLNIKDSNDQLGSDHRALKLLMEYGSETIFSYFNLLGKQKEPLWDQRGRQVFQGIIDNIRIAFEQTKKAVEVNELQINEKKTSCKFTENPFTYVRAARTRLESALIQIWVCEASFSRFLSLWRLYIS